ncbi:MAG: family transcriptional regulator [Microbacteriaceae bacterium]|jgi:predicted NBD/HSP70 family sugar kinase|nr:family transcriptional regulator [Microbacteriaceae bacterium]
MSDALGPLAGHGSGPGDLFQIFREGEAFTKSQLASITGLSRSTVSTRVDLLLSKGLLRSAGEAASSGGRPPARVELNPLARVVIGTDLGATHGSVALSSLDGAILATMRTDIRITDGPEPVLAWVVASAQKLLADEGFGVDSLAGVGVGVPGPVEHSTGRPTNPPIMPGWDGFDIAGYIQDTFDVPVLVDNDVNLLALGEKAMTWPDVDDLIFIKVSTGIGSGVISGGQLQRGAQGTAGDIGHVQVPYSRNSPRPPEDERDLEAIASGTAVARELRALRLDAKTSQDVVELVRSGDLHAISATRQAGREIGEVLATIVNLLNPSVVVVGGSIGSAGEHLLAGVREVVYYRSMPLATQHLSIVQSRAGDRAGVLGAAIMVIQRVLSAASVDAMCARDVALVSYG